MSYRNCRNLTIGSIIIASVACGTSAQPLVGASVLSVGGSYPTTVALSQSTCPGITVANATTTITHATGATTFTLSHAGNDYTGDITTTGDFTTRSKAVSAGGETHTLTIAGRFTITGFTATVTAAVTRPAAPTTCGYTVSWTGARTSGTNAIP